MNKDLDERRVPNGEYRDAMNVQVQTSEGSDVGSVQNILGNNFGCDYSSHANPIPSGSKTVGSVSDEKNDSLYWFIAGPSPDLEFPIENSISFKDMIMRTNKYKSTGCEPVFVDLWKYCTTINPLPGFSDNSISLLDTDGYDVVTTGMYATGYSGTGAGTIEFGPTLVTGVGNYNIIPLNYNIGSTVVANTYTPPLIEISDNTNTVILTRYIEVDRVVQLAVLLLLIYLSHNLIYQLFTCHLNFGYQSKILRLSNSLKLLRVLKLET